MRFYIFIHCLTILGLGFSGSLDQLVEKGQDGFCKDLNCHMNISEMLSIYGVHTVLLTFLQGGGVVKRGRSQEGETRTRLYQPSS